MKITDDRTISSIQEEFNNKFLNLKLAFYNQPHLEGEGSPNSEKLDETKTIGEVRKIHTSDDFQITPSMTVAELEKIMTERYGLNAQVFRLSNGLWLQTTATDHWTLENQNEKGNVFA